MKAILKVMTSSLILVSLFYLTGCNTTAGFGQDMQAGGQALTNAANKHKPN